jgi:hypothetical protein
VFPVRADPPDMGCTTVPGRTWGGLPRPALVSRSVLDRSNVLSQNVEVDLRARRHNGQVAANDFASSRARSMKSWATGLIVRFFNVMMPTLP